MRLDQALVEKGLVESRTEAQECVTKGWVEINGVVATKNNKTVLESDVITLIRRRNYVSRGGEKLEGIFNDIYKSEDAIRANIKGKHALDIGSSTGGFTDYLLQKGITQVDAVDVGSAQLHVSLLNDTRVALFENTDIREFVNKRAYDIIVADLSFISFQGIFEILPKFAHLGSECFILIKPQFEVGKGNTKKGIVKDDDLVKEVINRMKDGCIKVGGKDIQVFPCHIQGGDGNQEYFMYFKF
jgi:23S rRNA (cytidine1920-2'-O)/16S rRNA (cytidine1409-2'-O)-methyltransferase